MPSVTDFRVADNNALATIMGTWTPSPPPSSAWLGVALPNRKLPGLPVNQDAPAPSGDPANPTCFLGAYTVRIDRCLAAFEDDPFPTRWGRVFCAFYVEVGCGEGALQLAGASLCLTLRDFNASNRDSYFFDTISATMRTEGDYEGWHVMLLTVPFNNGGGPPS